MDASPVLVAMVLGGAAVLLLALAGRRWRGRRRDWRIPQGSDGWPLIGETLAFGNADPILFARPRIAKYGSVFRSNILGTPSIMVTSVEMAKFVYGERKLFKSSYPSTIATLVGKKFLSSCDPQRHPFLKRVVQNVLLPDNLRHEVGRIESFAISSLNSWVGRTIRTSTAMKEATLKVAVYFIFGLTDLSGTAEARLLVEMYEALSKGLYALPINLPSFTWRRSLQARRKGCEYLQRLIANCRNDESQEGRAQRTVLRGLVDCRDDSGEALCDDEIIDMLIGTLFGAHDTTATALTWIVKYLTEHHDVAEAVVAEQEDILKSKAPGEPLTWDDTRRMPYTLQVIYETLRLPTILQFTAREPLEDLQHGGFLLPKGWRVFLMTTCIHLDPKNYPNPTAFDPSRFKVPPKPGTYYPFASGAHMCPGNELAKLIMLVFTHHLTTKFRWQSLKPDMGTEFKPFALPKGGFPIQFERKDA